MAGKRRRRNGWGKVDSKGKRFYASYTGPDGKRHTPCGTSFAVEPDARAWLHAEKRLIDLGAWSPPAERKKQQQASSLTVGEWLEQHLELLSTGADSNRKSTMQTYRQTVENRITHPLEPGCYDPDVTTLQGIPVGKLSKVDVLRWWDGMQRCYPGTPVTNRKAYTRLRAAMTAAVDRELITVNPVQVAAAKKRIRTKEKYLAADWELAAILDNVPDQYRALTSLLLHHGLRIGEAIALEQRHVKVFPVEGQDLPRVMVTVEQNAQRLSEPTSHLEIQPPKSNAGYRTVPIIAADVPIFLAHLEKHLPGKKSTIATSKGPRRVALFTATRTGLMVRDTSFRSVLNRAKEKAGVDSRITPHSGRNWLITRLAKQGTAP